MISDFDQAMKDLLDLSRKILEFNSNDHSFATKKERKTVKNPFLKYLENYSADYHLSDEDGNKEDVIITYRKIKAALFKGWKVDDWLKNTNICIHSGAIEPDEKRKINLSALYTMACRQRDQSKDNLKGFPVEAFDGHEELLFPARFQLYMYRVFLFSLNKEDYNDDITKLGDIVTDLEKELKINPSKKLVPSEGTSNPENSLMDGFYGLAKDLVSKMGVQIPEGSQMPANSSNMMEAAASIFTRPETKDLLADIGQSMKEAKDFGDAIQKVVTKFQDPNSINKLKKMATDLIPSEKSNSVELKQE